MTPKIKQILSQCGINEVGICKFSDIENHLLPCRARDLLPHNASSVIVVLFPYYAGEVAGSNISKYAWGRDYHRVCGELLAEAVQELQKQFAGEEFVPFVDNSPIPEVKAAYLAGLGDSGDHGLLISPTFGSFVFIGCIVTTLELMPSRAGGSCSHCGNCVKACPTGALAENGRFNKEKCLSSITQQKGTLTEVEAKMIAQSGCVWGCDVCQTVCPHNQGIPKTSIPDFGENLLPILTEKWINTNQIPTDRAFFWRGKEILLRNLGILK